MTRIVALSGSLRKGSYNSALLRAAKSLHPEVIHIGSIAGIPLYDADVETAGFPPQVVELRREIAAADGVLLATPEYNNSMPGVLKNAIDWLSRPSEDHRNVFRNKPVAVIGATPGGFGTVSAQTAWLPVWRTLAAQHWPGGRLLVSRAHERFGKDRGLDDEDVRERLEAFVTGFIAFCEG